MSSAQVEEMGRTRRFSLEGLKVRRVGGWVGGGMGRDGTRTSGLGTHSSHPPTHPPTPKQDLTKPQTTSSSSKKKKKKNKGGGPNSTRTLSTTANGQTINMDATMPVRPTHPPTHPPTYAIHLRS